MTEEEKFVYALLNTKIVRPPKQRLATFGTTNMHYYIVTTPAYADLDEGKKKDKEETVIREGRVLAEKPQIITPYYLLNLFEGFEHGMAYARYALQAFGPHEPGLMYHYKNEPGIMNIVSNPVESVIAKINEEVDQKGDPLSVIIRGIDELWDVSLMKFIHEMTSGSLRSNVNELGSRRLLDVDHSGVPRDARNGIEALFGEVESGNADPSVLRTELVRWGLFDEYQDRFLNLFRKSR